MQPLSSDGLILPAIGLRALVLASLVGQAALLALCPVPSPVSIGRRLGAAAQGMTEAFRPVPAALALAGVLASAGIALRPPLLAYVAPIPLPSGNRPEWGMAAALAMGVGHVLVFTATRALHRGTAFDACGESRRLLTWGVFGLLRHPIAAGLGCIYLGLVLAAPNALNLTGLLAYGWHQRRQLAAEERLLAKRFGEPYNAYRRTVGKIWPRWRRGACAPRGK